MMEGPVESEADTTELRHLLSPATLVRVYREYLWRSVHGNRTGIYCLID